MSGADFEVDTRGYEDEVRGYDRDGDIDTRSPRGGDSRARSASPDGRDRGDRGDTRPSNDSRDEINPGTNLFVTGIHPRLTEQEVTTLFEQYGEVEKCNIMRDPHSGESRGFGFVKMVTAEHADAVRDKLQGQVHEGRTLSIEKARRARPRTPTPGKYYGPPKREFGGRPPRGGRDDRRGGYGRRDDSYGGGGYRGGSRYGGDRYEDRGGDGGYDRRYRDRGEYGRVDRYAGGGAGGSGGSAPREDRYGGREDRYGGGGREERSRGGGYYGREERGYDQAPPPRDGGRDAYGGGRGYEDRGDDRYSR